MLPTHHQMHFLSTVAQRKIMHTDMLGMQLIFRLIRSQKTALYIIGGYYHKPTEAMKKFKKLGYKNLTFGGYMEEHHGMLTR